jgi:gamma-glutamylcyclotransferase (GGCT)/AIG2-like uncharacterized protein YtfP
MRRLFAYGTLMCPEIIREVSGITQPGKPAVLHGFARYRVRGEHYPAITAQAGARVEGLLYDCADAEAWRRLDLFEGEMYLRSPVQVELADGSHCMAGTYVIHPNHLDCLEHSDWDFEEFLRAGKAAFAAAYTGFEKL